MLVAGHQTALAIDRDRHARVTHVRAQRLRVDPAAIMSAREPVLDQRCPQHACDGNDTVPGVRLRLDRPFFCIPGAPRIDPAAVEVNVLPAQRLELAEA
jgi:hypothetical protein